MMTDSHASRPSSSAGPQSRAASTAGTNVSPYTLPELRAQLDQIDDTIHDLLMQRARVVEHVAQSGKRSAFRPGREAVIIRRLLSRHTGCLSPEVIFRIWRELLSGTTTMQAPIVAAVYDPRPSGALASLAREHFSRAVTLHPHGQPSAALAELETGAASIAVLPPPAPMESWWTSLLDGRTAAFVIARLPFWRKGAAQPMREQAYLLAAEKPDPSGCDRSLLGVQLTGGAHISDVLTRLAELGCTPSLLATAGDNALIEVAGFWLDGEDQRFAKVLSPFRWRVLGAFAEPVPTPAAHANPRSCQP